MEGGWESGDGRGRGAVKRGEGAGGGGEDGGGGPPPHCLHPSAPLPFVTEHNISLAGRANNGEVCVWGGGNGTLETHLRLPVKIR